MRQLFLVILLLNIALYYWQSGQEANTESVAMTVADTSSSLSTEPILLLSDMAQIKEPHAADTTDTAVHASVSDKNGHVEMPGTKPVTTRTKSVSTACYVIGPFDEEDWIKQIAMLLEARDVSVRRYRGSERLPDTYWIYIPVAGQHAAQVKLDEVHKRGILDSAVVRLSKNRYAISLGLYRHRASAERRISRLANLGYEVKLKERFKNKSGYWLLLEKPVESQIINSLQHELANKPEVAVRSRPCS